jgi:anti-sigma B factor antagonist
MSLKIESVAGARPEHRVLRLSGRLGLDSVPEFLKTVRGASEPVVILDFSDVPFIDSAGVGSLVQTYASFKKAQRQLALAHMNERVASVLEITKVRRLFAEFPSVAEAEEGLALPGESRAAATGE